MADQWVGCWVPTSSRMGPKCTNSVAKSHQDVAQNPSTSRCWGVLGPSSGCLGGSWRALGGVLGPSWPQEAPRHQKGERRGTEFAPPRTPKLGPKSIKICPKSDPKGEHFCDHFLDRLLKPFGAILAPTWVPKPPQNGAKLAPKSIQVGMLI